MTAPRLIRVSRCIYRQAGDKIFFHSIRLPGKQFPTKRKLAATTLTAAIREVETLNTRRREATLGVGLDPYTAQVTVGELAEKWMVTNCQDRNGQDRIGQVLAAESSRLKRLLPFWKHKIAREIVAFEDCPEYAAWRLKQRKQKALRLGRSIDAELTTLANLFAWAVRNPRASGQRYNPLTSRPRFDKPANVRHCTKVMPTSDENFHALAAYLLASDQSRPLGWQLLLEGLTGCRTSEILACRVDAALPGQPGYIDHTALHVHRCKDGVKPWAVLRCAEGHGPLRDCLNAFLNWHEQRYPHSPHFIPGRNAQKPPERNSLTHALHRACRVLGIPLVVSHGLRAYHVNALRSMGIADAEIAMRLGHKSTAQVEQTYGEVQPGWSGSWKMDFLPEDSAPAWAAWTPKQTYQKLIEPNTENENKSKRTAKTGVRIEQ